MTDWTKAEAFESGLDRPEADLRAAIAAAGGANVEFQESSFNWGQCHGFAVSFEAGNRRRRYAVKVGSPAAKSVAMAALADLVRGNFSA